MSKITLKYLPNPCRSITQRVVIGGVKIYFIVSMFENGQPGGLSITCDQSGGSMDGFSEAWAITVSRLLRKGESLRWLIKMFSYQQFEPKGKTDNPDITEAFSIPDFIVRWLAKHYGESVPPMPIEEVET